MGTTEHRQCGQREERGGAGDTKGPTARPQGMEEGTDVLRKEMWGGDITVVRTEAVWMEAESGGSGQV